MPPRSMACLRIQPIFTHSLNFIIPQMLKRARVSNDDDRISGTFQADSGHLADVCYRLDVRYRPNTDPPARPTHLATLNGTAIAVGRTIIALLENGQQPDGSIVLPAALHGLGAPDVLASAL